MCQMPTVDIDFYSIGEPKKLNTSSGENSHGERQETCDALL